MRGLRNNFIPPNDFDRIMRCADPDDRIIFTLLAETGFRVNDLLKLRQHEAQRSLDTGLITLYEHKTRKTRTVKMSSKALIWLYIQLKRNTAHKHPLKFVFASRTKKQGQKSRSIHRSTIHKHFADAVKRAGLAGKGYTVMKDLNHDKLSTTLLYLSDLSL